jgi:methyl-accepting chemotaxis protein
MIAQEDIIFNIKLDSLSHNFKSMIVALHQMFQEIKNTNEKLEAIVEIRTQELSVINEELAPEVVQ